LSFSKLAVRAVKLTEPMIVRTIPTIDELHDIGIVKGSSVPTKPLKNQASNMKIKPKTKPIFSSSRQRGRFVEWSDLYIIGKDRPNKTKPTIPIMEREEALLNQKLLLIATKDHHVVISTITKLIMLRVWKKLFLLILSSSLTEAPYKHFNMSRVQNRKTSEESNGT